MESKIIICLLYENCFEIKKDYFKEGFPLEIYETIMSIQAAFFLSHNIRRNTQLFLIFLLDNIVIRYIGNKLRYLGPDERSIGMLLMKALEKKKLLIKSQKMQSTPGIWVEKKNFQDLCLEFGEKSQIYILDNSSKMELKVNFQNKSILLILNAKNVVLYEEKYFPRVKPLKFVIKDLPKKMRNYITILKFYSLIDNF